LSSNDDDTRIPSLACQRQDETIGKEKTMNRERKQRRSVQLMAEPGGERREGDGKEFNWQC